MRTKTRTRLFALILLPALATWHAAAQGTGNDRPSNLPDANSVQRQGTNRQGDRRTLPRTYGIAPTPITSAAQPTPPPVQPDSPPVTPPPSSNYYSQPQTPAQRATVSYSGGQLTVVASNSSLNQILREVSRQVDIKITGGVTEERVFGKYGPGTPSEVLGDLLDGTGGNVFFVQGSGGHAGELVLSNRTGGPTPPNPNAERIEAEEDAASPPAPAPPAPPADDSQSSSVPSTPAAAATEIPPPAPSTDNNGNASGNSGSNGNSGSGTESGGAKTPQQIFDELMRLRQQKQPNQQ